MRLGAAAAGVLVGVLLVGASRAEAHATLTSTTPGDDELVDQAPAEVELRFDEPVELVEGGIEVIDPEGERSDRNQVDARDDGATLTVPIDGERRGTYTVAWRVVSEDGHNLSGSFVFHVGERTGAATLDEADDTFVDAVGGLGRWAGFAGALVVIGTGALAAASSESPVRRRLRPIVVGAALAGALGVAAALLAQTATASGRGLLDAADITLDLAFDSRNGTLTVLRAVALLVALMLAAVPWTWGSAARGVLPLAPAAAGLVSLGCASLAGHAWTASQRALAVTSDVVHVLAIGIWLGGLLGLLAVLRLASDPTGLVRRFSNASLVAVAAVAVSGTISGVIQVPSLDTLGSTGYGQLLLAKVVGFAVLVGLGFYNRQILLPRLDEALGRLTGSLRAELGVAVAVLAVTAVLVNQPPARDQEQGQEGPVSATVTSDDGVAELQATVDPGEVGPNDLHLYFSNAEGAELVVTAVEVTAATGDVPARRLTVTPVTPSHVSVLDASLSSTGRWTFQVTAVTADAGQPATFSFEVPLS